MSSYCSKCKKIFNDELSFCAHCGEPLVAYESPVEESTGNTIEVVTKKCPFCAESILKEAVKCKHCGEMLGVENKETSPVEEKSKKKLILMTLGIVILTIGIIWTTKYYQMDTTISVSKHIDGITFMGMTTPGYDIHERVNNLGLMNERQVGIIIGIAISIVGCALLVVGWLLPGTVVAVVSNKVIVGRELGIPSDYKVVRNSSESFNISKNFKKMSKDNQLWAYFILGFIILALGMYTSMTLIREHTMRSPAKPASISKISSSTIPMASVEPVSKKATAAVSRKVVYRIFGPLPTKITYINKDRKETVVDHAEPKWEKSFSIKTDKKFSASVSAENTMDSSGIINAEILVDGKKVASSSSALYVRAEYSVNKEPQ